eukprot:Sspe_Gene.46108::Locus_22954_Transcript_1_1_Confidence_1.000_Length_2542::g.46108::m.46108
MQQYTESRTIPQLPQLVQEVVHQPKRPLNRKGERKTSYCRGTFSSSSSESAGNRKLVAAAVHDDARPRDAVKGQWDEIQALQLLEERQRSSREHFVMLLREAELDLKHFHSPTVSCEVILQQAAIATAGMPSPNALRTAVSCYVFDKLACGLGHVFHTVRNEVFTSLFDMAETPVHQGPISDTGTALRYIGSPFHFEQVLTLKEQLLRSHRVCKGMAASFNRHQDVLHRSVAVWQQLLLVRIFHGWREWHRRHKRERWVRKHRMHKVERDAAAALMECMLLRWKCKVEKEKCKRYMERESSLLYQLGNAKNQFTLQCFKTERFLVTIEELRKKLAELTQQLAEEKRKNHDASALLNVEHNKRMMQMNAQIGKMALTTYDWMRFTEGLVRHVTQDTIFDARMDPLKLRDEAFSRKPQKRASLHNPYDADEIPQSPAELILLNWANGLLKKSEYTTKKSPVSNFGTDWADGEYLVVIMNKVAPSICHLQGLQESQLPRRMEVILEGATRLGLSVMPRPGDIMEGVTDIIFMFLAELFRHYTRLTYAKQEIEALNAEKRRLYLEHKNSKRAVADVVHAPDSPKSPGGTPARPSLEDYLQDRVPYLTLEDEKDEVPEIDSDNMQDFLSLCHGRLEEAVAKLEQHAELDAHWEELVRVVDAMAMDLMKARAAGRPKEIISPSDASRFLKFSKQRLRDLAPRYTVGQQQNVCSSAIPMQFDAMLDEIARMVKQIFSDLRRVFLQYALSGAGMSAADYWKFCCDIKCVDRDLTRHVLAKIFTRVNADSDDSKEDNPETELVPSEFTECLVRMADIKFPGEPYLHTRFSNFLNLYVFANVGK